MTHAEQARARKARALADALIAGRINCDKARRMNSGQWVVVAYCADCRPPGSKETKQAVYRLLEEHESKREAECRKI